MAARRLILAMIVLLVVSSVAAALIPIPEDSPPASTTTTAGEPREPAGELRRVTMRAAAEEPQRVRIQLGDQLALEVTNPTPDQVEIPRLGELADVDGDAPAVFDLLPFERGSYRVELVDARKAVGWIVVGPQAETGEDAEPGDAGGTGDAGAESASDSPG